MTMQHLSACASEHIVDPCRPISTSCGQLITCGVEASIQDFIVVAPKCFDTVPSSYIPKLASLIDGSSDSVFSSEVKLGSGQLTGVSREGVDALSSVDIPYLGSVIEGSS